MKQRVIGMTGLKYSAFQSINLEKLLRFYSVSSVCSVFQMSFRV